MCAKMETNESKPKPLKYKMKLVCEQAKISKFYLKETTTDIKADETQVESSNHNLNSEERNTEKKKSTALSQSGTGIEFLKDLTETPTDSTVEQPKVESAKDNKPEPLRHIKRNTWKKKRTVGSQSGTGIEQRKRIFRIFLKVVGSAANQKSNVLLLIFLTFSPFSTTYGQDLRASIETSPIILGKDATFKCSIKRLHIETSLASPGWLKGNAKDKFIYSNISTKGGKYTPEIFIEADSYIYLMIIHNMSLSDLDTYTCEIGFYQSTISFTMEEYLPFIYFPGNNDTVYNISKTEMNVLIERKCQEPYCIALYNDEDITQSMIKVDNPETTTYSIQLQMDFRECNGNLYKSCILGLMSFNLTKQIQQCTDVVISGMESSKPKQEPTGMKTVIIAIIISMIVAVIIVAVIIACLCNRRKIIECRGCGEFLSVPIND